MFVELLFVGGVYGALSRERNQMRSEMTEVKSKSLDSNTRVRLLEDRLEKSLMACEALWTLVRDKLGATEQDLLERINEIDLMDGLQDGKAKTKPLECPHCGRVVSRRHQKCLYCGASFEAEPFRCDGLFMG